MTSPARPPQSDQDAGHTTMSPLPPMEEPLGEQLIREAREHQSEFVSGWSNFMQELGIRGAPIGAKRLRELLVADGVNAKQNEFSQGIIAMREE